MIPEILRTTLDPWRLLGRMASASTGKRVQVVNGRFPMVARTGGAPHFNRIHLPEGLVAARKGARLPRTDEQRPRRTSGICTERQFIGSFCHEELHVALSDPEAVDGAKLGPGLLANALEDFRIEHQGISRLPGLVPPTRAALKETIMFALRNKQVATSANTQKPYQIGVCLYLGLSGAAWHHIARVTSSMACAVAQELFPIAERVRTARSTWEVMEIANELWNRMMEAAKKVAARAGTAVANRWVRSLRQEMRTAMKLGLNEVLIGMERRKWPGIWFGPWYRGMLGGYRFHPHLFDPSDEDAEPLALPSRTEIQRLLAEADPLNETMVRTPRCLFGSLHPEAEALVRGVVGRDRCIFERVVTERMQLLLSLLAQTEFLLVIDGHARYAEDEWILAKQFAGTMARLLSMVRVPLCMVRSYHATRGKEWVENPKTKQRSERWSKDFHINITAIKDPKEAWDASCERTLENLSKAGFGLPLEGYPQVMRHKLELPSASKRPRVVFVVGNACEINVLFGGGNLREAVAPLRKGAAHAVYVHVGPWIRVFDPVHREIDSAFDALIQEQTLPGMVVAALHAVLRVVGGNSD